MDATLAHAWPAGGWTGQLGRTRPLRHMNDVAPSIATPPPPPYHPPPSRSTTTSTYSTVTVCFE
jgi:hypothetical protein